ncbi:DUF2933 domain-containing protein [Kordiimonas aquimaris]|uniref:DUF2933 domain-containing protein n=1 Tax=Kordiimonas aquimaris TaxID=707591 RepID=UPI0021CE5E64|nr:DUF2933 domain-containing protein [Kordiimonas aquimaris]
MKSEPGFFQSRIGFVFSVFLAVAALMLLFEHKAHINLGGILPLLLLVGLCVGMHFFMHHGHSDHYHSDRDH